MIIVKRFVIAWTAYEILPDSEVVSVVRNGAKIIDMEKFLKDMSQKIVEVVVTSVISDGIYGKEIEFRPRQLSEEQMKKLMEVNMYHRIFYIGGKQRDYLWIVNTEDREYDKIKRKVREILGGR